MNKKGLQYHCFEINGLSDEFFLGQRVSGLRGDGVDRALVDLLLHGTEQQVQWLAGALSHELVQQEGEPSGQHFLRYTLGSVKYKRKYI